MTRSRLILVFVLLLAGCSGNRINPSTLTADQLYETAQGFYQANNLGRALPLMESFVQLHFGDPRAPDVRLQLGQAYQRRRQWITAAAHFQRLVEDYPTNPNALVARFGICESYYRLSPPPQLDQEYTYAGIAHCESVATNYPDTEQGRQAAQYLQEMRDKLAQKVYDAGMHYTRRRAHDAAVVYFQRVVTNFPQTKFAPMALLRLVETYTTLGYVEEAQIQKDRLLSEFPDSPEARQVQG